MLSDSDKNDFEAIFSTRVDKVCASVSEISRCNSAAGDSLYELLLKKIVTVDTQTGEVID